MSLKEKMQYTCQVNGFAALTIISGAALICSNEDKELIVKGDTFIVSENCQISLRALENAELILTKYP